MARKKPEASSSESNSENIAPVQEALDESAPTFEQRKKLQDDLDELRMKENRNPEKIEELKAGIEKEQGEKKDPQEVAFLQALIENPNDNETLGVYSDWLQDHNREGEFKKIKSIVENIKENDASIQEIKKSLEFQKRMEAGRNPSEDVKVMQSLVEGAERVKQGLQEELQDPEAYAKKKEKELNQMTEVGESVKEKRKLEDEKRIAYEKRREELKKKIGEVKSFEELFAVLGPEDIDGRSAIEDIKRAVESAKNIGYVPDANMPRYIKGLYLTEDFLHPKVEELYQKSKKRWYKPWTWQN